MATTDDNRPILPMDVGLRVDILDGEGIWNTGRIVDINREEEDMVEIKYDGWGDEYNEWIPLSMKRIAPLHMYTMVKKCWAKLNKWPWWPAFVVLRAPSTKSAADALEEETKVYVEFFDSYDEEKRSRCWMQKKAIASFQEGFDERAAKNFGKSFPQYVEGTQRAMAGGSPVLFTGHGTLPIEFSSKFSIPLEQHKAALVDSEKKWYEAYRIFSDRYKLLYGIEYAPQATAEVLAQHAKKAAGVKGRGKSAAAAVEEEEDGSSDDVEIIEQKMPLPAKRGNRTTPSTGALPVKRGRGRPPKHAKATPPTTEEESDDEKIEPASEVDDDVHEEEEEEDDDEANGLKCGRRVIAKKRKTETPPRNTRSRLDSPTGANSTRRMIANGSDASGEDEIEMEDDDFEIYVVAKAPSQSLKETPTKQTPKLKHKKEKHKPVVLRPPPVNTKRKRVTALDELTRSPPPRVQPPLGRPVTTDELTDVILGVTDVDEPKKKPVVSIPYATTLLQRQDRAPDVLFTSTRQKSTRPLAVTSGSKIQPRPSQSATEGILWNPSMYRHWIGLGAPDEGGQPWSIQDWLLNGLKRKLRSEAMIDA